jgi:Bacterial regulatory proteins, luxR family
VAALVARGLTNRQVAEALVIAERTAEARARNIRGELRLTTRAHIAAWASQQELISPDRGAPPPPTAPVRAACPVGRAKIRGRLRVFPHAEILDRSYAVPDRLAPGGRRREEDVERGDAMRPCRPSASPSAARPGR